MTFRGCPDAVPPTRIFEAPSKIAILDRDGVVNVDRGYVYRQEDFEWVPGFLQSRAALEALGYKIVVATNQSGIGRGLYSEEDFLTLSEWLMNQVPLDGICYCPHAPEANCPARKPSIGMLEAIDKVFGIDKEHSFFVGDKESDMIAAQTFGIKGYYFKEDNLFDFLTALVLR